jgi:2,5-diamino-6-(ribosylamino)-4(3H)-pyrimidinone 5'-phosphate reductase
MMAFEDDAVRLYRHELRAHTEAIMVGSNTIRFDDPYLTVRDAPGKSPLRIIASSMADLPITSHVFADGGGTLVATSEAAPEGNVAALNCCGVNVVAFGQPRVDLNALLEYLGSVGVSTLIVEGGATLLSSFFRSNLVDRLIVQHLPVIFGGHDTPSMVGGPALQSVDEAILLKLVEIRRIGSHAVIVYERR